MDEIKKREIKYDCQYYMGDSPCIWHKKDRVVCTCDYYSALQSSLLIIKLDAVGDVLRTTCLLPLIKRKWPQARITWITRAESVPLLEHNPYITEVVSYDKEALIHLSTRTYDRVINLDAGKISSGMAAMARAKEKIGYILHENGYVTATNEAAEEWLEMGVFDDFKKANQRSHQENMCRIIGLPSNGMKYVFELNEDEKESGLRQLKELGIDLTKQIIGIHTGGGGRWILKQWQEKSFITLIDELHNDMGQDIQVLIFGGPLERKQNRRIMKSVSGSVFDAGCDNTIRHFAAMVNYCSVVLSGDSLAMHISLALGRRTVVLFGPTSHSEIELFGLGEKVIPEMDCLVCYKRECDFNPNCMESISVDMVKEAILRQSQIKG